MYKDLFVAAVIPAFNEEQAIGQTLQVVPRFVDHVIVVDDASSDATFAVAEGHAAHAGWVTAGQHAPARSRPGAATDDVCTASATLGDRDAGRAEHLVTCSFEIIRHGVNRGVGAAIVTGYRRALAHGFDVAVVMAGDGQMDPADLPGLLDPIAEKRADYSKGNRFLHRAVWRAMPLTRIVGNLVLSLATRLTSGYWHIFDSQCGYTAISCQALAEIDLDRVFSRYGYPNDVLARLHAAGMRVIDVPVRPIYGPGWKSGIGLVTVIYPVSFVLLRSWLHRLAMEIPRRVRRVLPRGYDGRLGQQGETSLARASSGEAGEDAR